MHAGVVVRREDIPPELWPSSLAVPPKQFVEIGWGDNEGYRFPWTFRIVVGAMFKPNPSVLFVQSFDEPVIEHFDGRAEEIIEVHLSEEGFARMCAYFESYFRLDAHGRPIALGDDFYVAEGSYHAFRNSNHWTARALREAGCPISSSSALTAGNVMNQSRKFGKVVWRDDE